LGKRLEWRFSFYESIKKARIFYGTFEKVDSFSIDPPDPKKVHVNHNSPLSLYNLFGKYESTCGLTNKANKVDLKELFPSPTAVVSDIKIEGNFSAICE
jgi:hypothetical protein